MSLTNLIGTQAFLPALLQHIRNSATSPLVPLDQVIFQSILLCLVAGEKNLIIRTPDEDVALAVQLAVWTLSCIFNLSTRKVKIRPRTDRESTSRRRSSSAPVSSTNADSTATFLRSLFIQPNSQDDDGETLKHHRRTPPNPRGAHHKLKRPHTEYYTSSSPTSESFTLSATGPTIVKPKPIYPKGSLMHTQTDPLPLQTDHRRRKSSIKHAPTLPQALVLSSLEDANDSVQLALAKVLAEKKVVLSEAPNGTWPLPADFIAIFVCPWNATERPAIHKVLLDKFAMSASVFITQNIRREFRMLPFASIPRSFSAGEDRFGSYSTPGSPISTFAALPTRTPPPAAHRTLPTTHQRSATYPAPAPHHPQNPVPVPNAIPPEVLAALRATHANTTISPRLALYLSDLFSATRAHPRLDAMLLTARAHADAAALVRAARVLGGDLTGAELLRPVSVSSAEGSETHEGENDKDEDEEDDDDWRSALDVWPESASAHVHESEPLMPGSARGGAALAGEEEAAPAQPVARALDAAEVNVARVVPRVVSHRVRLREGPHEEVLASVLFGATFGPGAAPRPGEPEGKGEVKRIDSVKSVLVQILADV